MTGKGNWAGSIVCSAAKTLYKADENPAQQSVESAAGAAAKDQEGALRMGRCVRLVRGLALCCVVLGGTLVGAACVTVASSGVAVAQTVNSVVVEGNRRVEADTVRSYFKGGPGGQLGAQEIDEGLKS